ncbi:Potassium voltage-gated channel unc-103 (Ether-a-go-go-related gene potassium channel homolog) (ERG homolog) (Eag-related protein homolog) (Ether-a-go-go-related protein homolog) (Uncoordinated protein 103) [Durusdinium trenchii]|uniref:Ion transport domain-containing protein n=1 Tax=Durusdinium trenchii TaxID=1381693 RepID=A0ABP0KND3_9DINO
MRPTYVARKYLRSWFLVDLTVVVTDWVLLVSSGLDDMEILRVLRLGGLLRVLRLLRIFKVADRSSIVRLKEAILNDHNKAVSSVLQLLFVVVMINHYVGCGWFAVGQVEGFDKSWVSEHLTAEAVPVSRGPGENPDQQVLSQYLTSVHWAVTQFTPAAMDVVPVNPAERMYAIVVIFSGLVMFSSFVSSMTSAMDLINKLNFEQRQKSTALRQYIKENRVTWLGGVKKAPRWETGEMQGELVELLDG